MIVRGKLYLRRPMKILKVDGLHQVVFPTFIMPKYPSELRVLRMSGVWVDENRAPLPSHIKIAELPDGIDGTYHDGFVTVYDYVTPLSCGLRFRDRLKLAKKELQGFKCGIAPALYLKSSHRLLEHGALRAKEEYYFRHPNSQYVQGKHTRIIDQGWLEYTVPHEYDGVILDIYAKTRRKRKYSKFEQLDRIGGIIVEDTKTKQQFPIVSNFGLDGDMIWRNRVALIGATVRYSCTVPPSSNSGPSDAKYVSTDLRLLSKVVNEDL